MFFLESSFSKGYIDRNTITAKAPGDMGMPQLMGARKVSLRRQEEERTSSIKTQMQDKDAKSLPPTKKPR